MLFTVRRAALQRHVLEVHRVQLDDQAAEQGEGITDKDEM
jgi:hypothetical protein